MPKASKTRMPEPVDFREAAETFDMLSAPTRVRILWLLAQGEQDVSSLAESVDATIAAVSQHLAKLKLADLVTARTEGRRQIYRVEDPHILTVVNSVVEHHVELRRNGR